MSAVTAALVAATIALGGSAPAATDRVAAPAVPTDLVVTDGSRPFLRGHAVGTQNYICAPAATPSGVDWFFIGPQATLFNDYGEQIVTHFLSMNPFKGDVLHATWQHSRDTSAVWGAVMPGHASADPAFVAPGAIPWLLVTVVGTQVGPTGGGELTQTTFIQRLNTAGGAAPAAGCSASADVGTHAFVPSTTDYHSDRAAR